MTRNFADITAEVEREYSHEIGIALYLTDKGKGWAYAAVLPHAGAVLAWDGRYFFQPSDHFPSESYRAALGDLAEWTDRDVGASQILMEQNAAWLRVLGSLLYPSWSLTQLATRLLATRLIDGRHGLDDHEDHVVAYYPTRAVAPPLGDE